MREIELSHGYMALVDDDDYDRVAQFIWSALVTPYTVYGRCEIDGKKRLLHRFIMNPPDDKDVAHLDNDGLNCQKDNLRITTRRMNIANSPRPNLTGYRGVKQKGYRWEARIQRPDGTREALGHFSSAEEAALAYNAKAIEYFGEFAVLNDIQ